MPDAYLGLVARFGPVGAGMPALNVLVRAIGIELAGLAPAVPAGTAQALGGSCLDTKVDLAMAVDVLDCKIEVQTTGAYWPICLIISRNWFASFSPCPLPSVVAGDFSV